MAISLPDVNNSQGVADALAAVVTAMGEGSITADEASAMCAIIETRRRAIETVELEARMVAIEKRLKSDESKTRE